MKKMEWNRVKGVSDLKFCILLFVFFFTVAHLEKRKSTSFDTITFVLMIDIVE